MDDTARRQSHRGFTLVEVMVALVIMSVLAAMAWQGIDGIVRSRDTSGVRLEQSLRQGTVLMQWEQDLAALQENSAVREPFKFNGANVTLVRRTERGLQIVVWSLRSGLDGTLPGKTLLRWAGPPVTTYGELQDQWIRSQQLQGTEAEQVRAMQGVAEWQLYCVFDANWANCQSTGTNTGTGATQTNVIAPPPKGVRLEMSFADGSGMTGKLTRDTQLGPKWIQ